MFVLTGEVTNRGDSGGREIYVHGSLLDGESRVVAEKSAYAGTVLSSDELGRSVPAKIEESFSPRPGSSAGKAVVPPGESLPFMVVFPASPDGVSSFRISAFRSR